jgi:hypothetical protein
MKKPPLRSRDAAAVRVLPPSPRLSLPSVLRTQTDGSAAPAERRAVQPPPSTSTTSGPEGNQGRCRRVIPGGAQKRLYLLGPESLRERRTASSGLSPRRGLGAPCRARSYTPEAATCSRSAGTPLGGYKSRDPVLLLASPQLSASGGGRASQAEDSVERASAHRRGHGGWPVFDAPRLHHNFSPCIPLLQRPPTATLVSSSHDCCTADQIPYAWRFTTLAYAQFHCVE